MDESDGVTCKLSTCIGAEIDSSDVALCGVIVVGEVLFLVLGEVNSDNMGNNESSKGVSPAKEGRSLIKFPIVEEERVAFPMYHMNITPRAITLMPQLLIEPE